MAARQGQGGERRTDKLRGVDQDCKKEARGATAKAKDTRGRVAMRTEAGAVVVEGARRRGEK